MSVLGTVLDYIKYFDERKSRKQKDPLYEKEISGLNKLRGIIRDNVKLKRIGSPQGSIKININPEAVRRGLSRLKEDRDRRLESQQLGSSYNGTNSRGPTTIRGRSIDRGRQIL